MSDETDAEIRFWTEAAFTNAYSVTLHRLIYERIRLGFGLVIRDQGVFTCPILTRKLALAKLAYAYRVKMLRIFTTGYLNYVVRQCDMYALCMYRFLLLKRALSPDSRFVRIWTIFRVVMAVLVTIFVTTQAFFALHPGICLVIIIVFDILSWIDM